MTRMSHPDRDDEVTLPRRRMLSLMAGGGASALLARGLPGLRLAQAGAGGGSPESFLAAAYAQRARSAMQDDPSPIASLYSGNQDLSRFEAERVRALFRLGDRWGGVIQQLSSSVAFDQLDQAGSEANGHVYERITMQWVPFPRPVSSEGAEERRREPGKFQPAQTGPRGEVISSWSILHDVSLLTVNGSWAIVRDAYEEPLVMGSSPDLGAASWAAVRTGKPSNGLSQSPSVSPSSIATKIGRPNTWYSYDYVANRTYALAHCSSYNSQYCKRNCAGGDCANFASQCLYAGGEWSDSSWYCSSVSCSCQAGSGLSGSTTSVNNASLRSWLISTGRGSSMSTISQLGWGDDNNGTYDHVAVVTDSINQLVSAHDYDYCNISWDMGLPGAGHLFTWINSTYWM